MWLRGSAGPSRRFTEELFIGELEAKGVCFDRRSPSLCHLFKALLNMRLSNCPNIEKRTPCKDIMCPRGHGKPCMAIATQQASKTGPASIRTSKPSHAKRKVASRAPRKSATRAASWTAVLLDLDCHCRTHKLQAAVALFSIANAERTKPVAAVKFLIKDAREPLLVHSSPGP